MPLSLPEGAEVFTPRNGDFGDYPVGDYDRDEILQKLACELEQLINE